MSVYRIFAVFLRQFFVLKGSASRLFMIFYWSTLDLFLWGVLTIYLEKVGGAELNFVTVILGTVIFSDLLIRIQSGIAISALEDVWYRNFINLFASPLMISEYIGGLVLTSIAISFTSLAVMSGFAWLLFSYNIFRFGLILIPFAGVLFLFGLALGMASVALIIRFGPAIESLIWALPAFFAPFSGVFYPVSALPEMAQWFARILPSTYIFEGMRSIVLSGTFEVRNLLVAFLLALFYVAVTYFLLVQSYRLALKKGFLSRFVAENF